MTLADALERFDGSPIPRCPGRYVLRGLPATAGPSAVGGPDTVTTMHQVPTVRDAVAVAWLGEWGLISYARRDGSWLHTANTRDGFRRKLRDLRIASDPSPGDASEGRSTSSGCL